MRTAGVAMSKTVGDTITEFEDTLRQMSDKMYDSEELMEYLERFYELVIPEFYQQFRYWDFLRKFCHTQAVINRGVRNGLVDSLGRIDSDVITKVFD